MKRETGFSFILISILYLVLGIVFVAATEELIKTFNYILVCICAIIGVIQFLSFFVNKKDSDYHYTDLLLAVIFIWVSFILYVYYGFMINILPILFSLYLFVMASDMLVRYLQGRNVIGVNAKKYLIFSLVAVVIGLLLIFNPGSMIITYLKITGVYLIFVGIFYFLEYIKK